MSNSVPDLVPARMVNEFVYCPRLFYLEWVESQFSPNADTAEGTWRHRAVDRPGGAVHPPASVDDHRRATSVKLSSDRLGLIAVIDTLEQDNGELLPVDTKKGKPPSHGPAWEPEIIQVAVQGLILRDNGYSCNRGEIYFAQTRERREVVFDDALIARTLDTVADLRQVAASDDIPPPLVDSPKCPRCSLVGICLPDETNQLTDRSDDQPRRLVPTSTAAKPVYVGEQGAYIGVKSGRLRITKNREVLAESRLIDVSQVNVIGNAQVTSQAMRTLFDKNIPVLWFSYGGWFSGMAHGLPSKNVELRLRQAGIAAQAGLPIARQMIEGKIRNCRTQLMRNAKPRNDEVVASLKHLAEQAAQANSLESLLGFEGTAARLYFSQLPNMIRKPMDFDFTRRNRRPPLDPVNCLLSYLYGLLTKDLTATTLGVGLDPYVGVYHRPRFGRPALALDLCEEFRPVIADSVALNVINNGEISLADFVVRHTGVALTPDGRKSVIRAYERRLDTEVTHPVFGYKVTYRRVFEVQARLLAAHLMRDIPEYTPFVTR